VTTAGPTGGCEASALMALSLVRQQAEFREPGDDALHVGPELVR
jgi:hypothetical protein